MSQIQVSIQLRSTCNLFSFQNISQRKRSVKTSFSKHLGLNGGESDSIPTRPNYTKRLKLKTMKGTETEVQNLRHDRFGK